MSLRDGVLRALYDAKPGPYEGITIGQVADLIAPSVPADHRLGSRPKLGLLCAELSDLVEEGFALDECEKRLGSDEYATPIRTYRLTSEGCARAQRIEGIRFTTLTEQRT